jgi:hypothetical protein
MLYNYFHTSLVDCSNFIMTTTLHYFSVIIKYFRSNIKIQTLQSWLFPQSLQDLQSILWSWNPRYRKADSKLDKDTPIRVEVQLGCLRWNLNSGQTSRNRSKIILYTPNTRSIKYSSQMKIKKELLNNVFINNILLHTLTCFFLFSELLIQHPYNLLSRDHYLVQWQHVIVACHI